jgi:segregation and condensation protein A
MARSIAGNAIALLIDLAEQGEIDPWDVQVINVIDRVLHQIRSLAAPTGRSPYEADLSESGQAFLYASMLVLLKADSLARLTAAAEDPQDDSFDAALDEPNNGEPLLPARLERQLKRRASANPPQQRRVTLQELIIQLEVMAQTMASPRPRRSRSRQGRPQSRSQAVKTITQLAHQENLSEIALALEQFLNEHWPSISHDAEWIEFEHLLSFWVDPHANGLTNVVKPPNIAESHSEQGDRVGVFWALLYLSAQSKVELSQQQFYQDLHLRSLAEPASDHPVADVLADVSTVVLPD